MDIGSKTFTFIEVITKTVANELDTAFVMIEACSEKL